MNTLFFLIIEWNDTPSSVDMNLNEWTHGDASKNYGLVVVPWSEIKTKPYRQQVLNCNFKSSHHLSEDKNHEQNQNLNLLFCINFNVRSMI